MKKCKILPIEIIVRGYLTGSGWRDYSKKGSIHGIKLPEGLKKDSKFKIPILTPTTKAEVGHDMSISVKGIIDQKIISKDLMEKIEETTIKFFLRGQEIAQKNNLILVDTKYEFGTLPDGSLIVADEMHTSDCSRYWYFNTYQKLFDDGKEQKMLDKEFLRQWLLNKGFKGDGNIPDIPFDIILGVTERYLIAIETITGKKYLLENKDSVSSLDKTISNI